ncbi:hypothetical protein GCM10007928_34640 [Sulfitobacter porphyrae]|nr:hypothetical protein GCM10007928_34640 [Sulfitobacter porphyrae]
MSDVRTVLVLGGSRGIGAAIVRRFAGAGDKVTFTYAGSHEAAEQLARETGSTAVRTDSADRDAVIASVRESGPLDVLVVNSGIGVSAMRWSRTRTRLTGFSRSISTRPTMQRSKPPGTCPKAAGSS